MNETKLKIAIINFNTKDLLRECLQSVIDNKADFLFDIEVVDNASTDGSAEMIEKEFPAVKLSRNNENFGFAKAANQAIDSSEADFVFILNADTKLKEDCLNNLIGFMEKTPDCGAAGPLLFNLDGSVQKDYCGRRFLTLKTFLGHGFLGAIMPNNRFSKEYKMADWDRKTGQVEWISGSAIALRKKALQDSGSFDPDYFMYVEDMDLCYRLIRNGWKTYLVTESGVFHHIGQSSKAKRRRMKYLHFKSHLMFMIKRFGKKN